MLQHTLYISRYTLFVSVANRKLYPYKGIPKFRRMERTRRGKRREAPLPVHRKLFLCRLSLSCPLHYQNRDVQGEGNWSHNCSG